MAGKSPEREPTPEGEAEGEVGVAAREKWGTEQEGAPHWQPRTSPRWLPRLVAR